jgi:hypothetical protein
VNGYNFTDRVRKVLQIAREEAARLHHEFVGTEHILLGIIRGSEGVAAAALKNLGIDLVELPRNVENIVKEGQYYGASLDLPYTSRAKKILELAMSEARELNHAYVGTEHLLLGVLREEKGIGAQALMGVGVTLDKARAEVLHLLAADPHFRERVGHVPGDVDQRFKTGIALVELHGVRFGAYPDSLDDLRFVGPYDHRLLKGLRYEKLPDGYALEVDVPRGVSPELSYPPDFWRGLGIRRTNVHRGT